MSSTYLCIDVKLLALFQQLLQALDALLACSRQPPATSRQVSYGAGQGHREQPATDKPASREHPPPS